MQKDLEFFVAFFICKITFFTASTFQSILIHTSLPMLRG